MVKDTDQEGGIMNKKTDTRVLLYNLSPEGVLPLTERILSDRGMPFINVKSACELFTVPAFLAIVNISDDWSQYRVE